MYYKFLCAVVVFVVNGKNKWLTEWMNDREWQLPITVIIRVTDFPWRAIT